MKTKSFIEYCEMNDKKYLISEWDYSKNQLIVDIINVTPSSEKVVWWIGSCGHSFDMMIKMRTINSCNCPFCSGRRVLEGFNDFATVHPELLKDWDYDKNVISPNSISSSSSQYIWWKCENGHSWKSRLGNRTNLNRGCPYCSGSKLLKGYNDFETWCHNNNRLDLLKEWNYEKNNGLKPSEILQGGSGKKYWWIGSCGHEWDSVIASRITIRQGKTKIVKTAGCPYCSNPPKRILPGFNDFKSWCIKNHMEYLLNEWDYKNNTIAPTEVSYASGKQFWWKCSKNHRWQTTISQRTTGSKTYCPICSRTQTSFPEQAIAFYLKKVITVEQRIRINNNEVDVYIPELNVAIEYDGLRWHQGKENHDYSKTQHLLAAGLQVIRIKESQDVKSINSNENYHEIQFIACKGRYITEEFEQVLLQLFSILQNISNKIVIPKIDLKSDELSIMTHYMNTLKNNSVAIMYPELVDEWDIEKNDGVTPDVFSAYNGKKVWWKCKNNHSWKATINSRTRRKLGCPYCAGQRVIAGQNDFETWCKQNNILLLSEWNKSKNVVQPSEIPKTYKEKMWWKCNNGHEWQATVYNRVNGTGCPICNDSLHKKRMKISLADWCRINESPLCDEWDYLKNTDFTPEEVSHGSHKKVWWKCDNGHEWQAQIKSRTYNHGCPYCSSTNKKAIQGYNDLVTWCNENNRNDLIEEWNHEKNGDFIPANFTKGSHKIINWKCKNGHEWQAEIKQRTQINGNKCPYCK